MSKPSEVWYVRELTTKYVGRRKMLTTPKVKHPLSIYEMFDDMRDLVVEEFRIVLLDGRHHVMGWFRCSQGTLTASLVHPREVFAVPVARRAAAVVIVHNHPSGNVEPSREDVDVTQRLRTVGDIIGIPLIDHVIVGVGGFHSLRESGHFEKSSVAG